MSEQNRLRKIIQREKGNSCRRTRALYRKAQEWIMTFDSGQRWMNKLRKPMTKSRYTRAFFRYRADTGLNPDELIALKLEGLRNVGTHKSLLRKTYLKTILKIICAHEKAGIFCYSVTLATPCSKTGADEQYLCAKIAEGVSGLFWGVYTP